MAVDAFIWFEKYQPSKKLDDIFLKIDDMFLKLASADAYYHGKIFPKVEIDKAMHQVGADFHKLSDQFYKLEVAAKHFDQKHQAFDRLPGGGDGMPMESMSINFSKISYMQLDLDRIGADFIKLDTAPTAKLWPEKWHPLVDDFIKLSSDFAATGERFKKISLDYQKVDGTPFGLDYKAAGDAFFKLGQEFDLLASDSLAVSSAITTDASGGGGGSGLPTGKPGDAGAMLSKLFQDFQAFGDVLGSVGVAFNKISAGWDLATSKKV